MFLLDTDTSSYVMKRLDKALVEKSTFSHHLFVVSPARDLIHFVLAPDRAL